MSHSFQVGIVNSGVPPLPAAETPHARLARLRPADKTAAAISAALGAVVDEIPLAAERLSAARSRYKQKLLTSSPEDIAAAKGEIAFIEAEIEQLSALEAAHTASLAVRKGDEAAAAKRLSTLAEAARVKAAAFDKFVSADYPALAAAIAAGLALEDEAAHALAMLRAELAAWPGLHVEIPAGPVRTAEGKSYKRSISLPGYVAPAPASAATSPYAA